jgi:hypothetical protein
VAARKFRPIAGIAAAHHFGSDIRVVEETLRDNPVSICWFRPSIARGAGADLHTTYGLAPDQACQCVFRFAVSGMPSLRTVVEAGTQGAGNSDAAGDVLYAANAGIAQTLTGHSHNDTFVVYNSTSGSRMRRREFIAGLVSAAAWPGLMS